jgi:hypothetical protein
VRLAAKDGGDDELAGAAVVHQLDPAVGKFVCRFRNIGGPDIDGVVVAAPWERIRCFPWRRRSRCSAAALIYGTRLSIMSALVPGHTRRKRDRLVPIDPQSSELDARIEQSSVPEYDDVLGPGVELADFLGWALRNRVVTGQDTRLLVELVAADRRNASLASPVVTEAAGHGASVARPSSEPATR